LQAEDENLTQRRKEKRNRSGRKRTQTNYENLNRRWTQLYAETGVTAKARSSTHLPSSRHAKGLISLMSDHIYKKIELVGSSPNGIEEAVNNAISRADKTIRNMKWFEVVEMRGHLENNKIAHWQVTVKVGFTLDT
jgi:dodecin